jgi:hypothetical protein
VIFPDDQVEELRHLAPRIQLFHEGDAPFFLLERMPLPEWCTPKEMDALLCPISRDGYTSRLYFAEQAKSTRGQPNWTGGPFRILERNWLAYSWNPQRSDLRLAQIVANHLRAFR